MKNALLKNCLVRCAVIVLSLTTSLTFAQAQVTLTEVDEVIPTYIAGPAEPNPMFYFGKQSQGAEGRIYPYPLYDNLTNKKSDKTYHVVYLENEYVKIGILPEIGGRLFSALDKTNNYDFIYRQHVIKPALIGLIGSWISGGLEWNIPHHHRASTFIPVQWSTETNKDGSKTIWVGELEVRHRMRWAVGYTLRPGSSVLECNVRIINRTPETHSMLCFANVAVHIDENYQVIFPPRTQWVTGHSKRTFYPWPYAQDNKDMSWYKNNTNSASWFAVNFEDDFVAGYDHGKNAGTMNIADHHIVPGKKFFTWGIGNMWDNILTDDDGPYLEIMVGAYSDNQPDYSWMQPYEERSFMMSWYPFRGIEGAKNANLDATVNLEVKEGKIHLGFYTTKAHRGAVVSLKAGEKTLLEEKTDIDPGKPYFKEIAIAAGIDEHDLKAAISADGKELVSYSPVKLEPVPQPNGVENVKAPEEYENLEELYLTGQRIDQFHNPTYDADPYWEEVLSRDPGNVSANTGMGLLNLRSAHFEKAEQHFRIALERLTKDYTTPKNHEPNYYLGVALKAQGKYDEAFTYFYKSAWSQEWKAPSYYSMAEISLIKGDFESALRYVDQSLDANAVNLRAYGLKATVLRHLGKKDDALKLVEFGFKKTDPLDARLMAEKWMLTKDVKDAQVLFNTLNTHQHTAMEIAAEYYNTGMWADGLEVLSQSVSAVPEKSQVSPMVYYYMGHFAEQLGDMAKAAEYRKTAMLQSLEYVFPFQYEVINVLQRAMEIDPKDARAPYYLGNVLYDWKPEEAIVNWEKASQLDPNHAITWRNLAIAYSHRKEEGAQAKAISCLEKAIAVPNPYPTHFAELDRMYQVTATPVARRLATLEKYKKVVVKNDEALGDLITLKTFTGNMDEALTLLKSRVFSIWEGTTPFNSGQAWTDANLVKGLKNFKSKKYQAALKDFEAALVHPDNLRAEQRFERRKAEIAYWIGCTYQALGDKEKAEKSWNDAIAVVTQDTTSYGGRRRPADPLASAGQRYYQALSKEKLGKGSDNVSFYNELLTMAETELNKTDEQKASVPSFRRQLNPSTSKAMAHYVAGLAYAGQRNKAKAREELNQALLLLPDYLNAKITLEQL